MNRILQVVGAILLIYSVAGVALHALAKVEGFGHFCENFLVPAGENHLQLFTAVAAIAAVCFLIVKTLKKRRLRKAA